jgi:hypothetical protein
MNLYTIALLVLAPLLVWRVYRRLQQYLGRQRSIMSRHYVGVMVFTGIVLIIAAQVSYSPVLLAWLGLGTAAGVAWGIYGLRLTRFEDSTQYFTPNKRIGMAVAMVFFARLMYVGVEYYANRETAGAVQQFQDSPLTLVPLGLMAGYFATYSAGLVRWRLKLRKLDFMA